MCGCFPNLHLAQNCACFDRRLHPQAMQTCGFQDLLIPFPVQAKKLRCGRIGVFVTQHTREPKVQIIRIISRCSALSAQSGS